MALTIGVGIRVSRYLSDPNGCKSCSMSAWSSPHRTAPFVYTVSIDAKASGECHSPLAPQNDSALQQTAERRLCRDARGLQCAGQRRLNFSVQFVRNQLEGSGVAVAIRTQGDMLKYLTAARRVSDAARRVGGVIACPWNVVEVVRRFPGLLPDSQAEVSILSRPGRVHDLRSIAVPHHHRVVDHCIGNRRSLQGLRGKDDMPHSDNWGCIVVTVLRPEGCSHQLRVPELRVPADRLNQIRWQTALCHGTRHHG